MFQKQCRNLHDILAQGMHNRDLVVSNKITCIVRTALFVVTAHYCHERSTSGFTLSHQELLEVTSLAQSLTYVALRLGKTDGLRKTFITCDQY